MSRRRHHAVGPASLTLAIAVVAATLVGCSGDDAAPPDAGASTAPVAPGSPAEPEPVATVASINRIDGELADDARDRLSERVEAAIDAWIDGAYAGEYPRDDFSDAFTTFTEGARKRATDDEELLSYATIGPRLDAVLPVRRRLRIDVLGVEGRAMAVTARVDLLLELSGEITRTDRVTGSLYLTFEKDGGGSGWRIFGYDLSRRKA